MKKKYGFTLIELLAVIVILSIIALIASPIILNVIDESRDKANIDSTYNLVEAAKIFYVNESQDENKSFDGQVNYLDVLKITGDKPTSGYVYLNYEGEISVAALYGNKCYTKNFNEEIVTTSENIDDCLVKEALKDKVSNLPTKEVNVDGNLVNKVYGDKSVRKTMNNYI